jgi:hypothetical protein
MSSNPLLLRFRSNSTDSNNSTNSSEMSSKNDSRLAGDLELVDSHEGVYHGRDAVPYNDATAPSVIVSSKRQRISDLFTILCAGCALISDGYANSLMTLINVVLRAQYPTIYTSSVSTRISNALLIGEIIGQITVG